MVQLSCLIILAKHHENIFLSYFIYALARREMLLIDVELLLSLQDLYSVRIT